MTEYPPPELRDPIIARLRDAGWAFREIGAEFDISAQRVRQIVQRQELVRLRGLLAPVREITPRDIVDELLGTHDQLRSVTLLISEHVKADIKSMLEQSSMQR